MIPCSSEMGCYARDLTGGFGGGLDYNIQA
jgi:hypothetical protein